MADLQMSLYFEDQLFYGLPMEVFALILTKLDFVSILALSHTSKSYRKLILDYVSIYLKKKVEMRFPDLNTSNLIYLLYLNLEYMTKEKPWSVIISNPTEVLEDGTLVWKKNGLIHRDDNLPAIVHPNHDIEYRSMGVLHNTYLPSLVLGDGTIEWYENDENHRLNGPAVIDDSGVMWFNHGKVFRGNDKPPITRL